MRREDILIEQAVSCLKDHLKNHPDRDGNSIGYRIEQAVSLLQEAHRIVLHDAMDGKAA